MRRLLSPIALTLLFTFACDAPSEPPSAKPSKSSDKAEPVVEVAPEPAQPTDAPPAGVKVHGNLPVLTESELAAQDSARDECVRACVSDKAREARSAEDIERGCKDSCAAKLPIEQVEVVSDRPPGL